MITHLAIHHPVPEYRAELLASMRRVDAAAAGQPGLIRINGWSEIDGDRLVGISMWESMDAFRAARGAIFATVADDPFDLWESGPVESMFLEY
ncbi:MAG TPA: antibiotic biosynthesis monooxygenase [Galbitalea sp.]